MKRASRTRGLVVALVLAVAASAAACSSHTPASNQPALGVSAKPTAVASASAAPIAAPSASASVKPASTGAEAPKPQLLTPENALPHVQAGLAEAPKATPDCK